MAPPEVSANKTSAGIESNRKNRKASKSEESERNSAASGNGAKASPLYTREACSVPSEDVSRSDFRETPLQNRESAERIFADCTAALDAAEAARLEGNKAYNTGHLYDAISTYSLAERHLSTITNLEDGLFPLQIIHNTNAMLPLATNCIIAPTLHAAHPRPPLCRFRTAPDAKFRPLTAPSQICVCYRR